MAVIFNPSKILKKVLPKDSDDLLTKDLKFNDKFKRSLLRLDYISNKDLKHTIDGSLKFYKEKITALKAQGESAKDAKATAINDGKLINARVSDLVVEKAAEEIKEKYAGKKFIWLPSDAEEQDPIHALNYGKTFDVDKGDKEGQIPGQRYGCRCGMEILGVDDKDAPEIYRGKSQKEASAYGAKEPAVKETAKSVEPAVNQKAGKEPKDAQQYKPLGDEYVKQFSASKITKEEADIILNYSQMGFIKMNALARGEEVSSSKGEIEKIQKDNKTLQELINKNELPQTMLYRFIDYRELQYRWGKDITDKVFNVAFGNGNAENVLNEIRNFLSSKQYDVWAYNQFVSTTRRKGFNYQNYSVKINIKVSQGTKGLPVENLSRYQSEREVILNVGTKLKIEDIRFNKAVRDGNGGFEIDAVVI